MTAAVSAVRWCAATAVSRRTSAEESASASVEATNAGIQGVPADVVVGGNCAAAIAVRPARG
ncbi:hypothetical protein ACWFPY_29110 [Nocardia fluminea]